MWQQDTSLLELIEWHIPDVIAILDAEGIIRYMSPSHYHIFGISASALVGRRAIDLIHPEDQTFIAERLEEIMREETYYDPIEVRYRDAAGLWLVIEVRGNAVVREGLVTSVVLVIREVSRRKQEEAFIHFMAYHDALTGLPNRAALYEKLDEYMKWPHRGGDMMALILLDLDEFKQVNDTYGHIVGDGLLRHVARQLEHVMGPFGYVARLGGDEYVAIAPRVRRVDDMSVLAESVMAMFGVDVQIEGLSLDVSVSLGISLYPLHGQTVVELLDQADRALYAAKRGGRRQYAFAPPS